jgi:GT2 family glycosyltransferase
VITIAIPTFNRGPILIETIRALISQEPPPDEILVLDQTQQHREDIEDALSTWHDEHRIRWIRLNSPSVPRALNEGLVSASCEKILFLDDDIVPEPGLVAAHKEALERDDVDLVAGRVIQPWHELNQSRKLEEGNKHRNIGSFSFAQKQAAWVSEFMGGNFSIHRELALAVGGFDENFVHVAYRFEAEFAYRLRQHHRDRIYFEPNACVHHLKAASGGTRMFGHYLMSFSPSHSVGAYYYHLRTWCGWSSFTALLNRPRKALVNRHHLRKPWWIAATIVAECSGLLWASYLALRGPRHLCTKATVEQK